jgi:hypothetical protein
MSPETALAIRLAMLETRIGIRSEQLNAWRDYTSALQALLPPDPLLGGPGEQGPEGAPEPGAQAAPDGAKNPFAFEEKLADDFAKRAAAAERLKAAIATLRTTLTPEQLEILASTGRSWGPPLGPWDKGGPSEEAAGPGGLPPGKRLPMHVPPAEGQL